MAKQFHHVGLPTTERQPGETWVEQTRVWVSDPMAHPNRIEWLRYEPDSPVDPALQRSPHVAYTVDDLDAYIAGKEVVLGPFEPGDAPFARVAFTREDGLIIEYMQLYPGHRWFDGTRRG